MEQDRFDDLAKKVFSGSSRRRVIGGAIASVVGAGVAAVTGASAKNNKAKAQGKKGKGKAKGEFTCSANNANDPGQGGCQEPDACCRSTPGGSNPICVLFGTQANGTQQFCGDLDGQGVCRTCPAGTVCSLDGDGEIRCVCTSSSCANGCCIDNDQTNQDDECVTPNGNGQPVNSINPDFDGSFVCGTGGSVCNVCSIGTLFSGCCTATGACSAGTTNNNCGSSGEPCKVCLNDSSCGVAQACTGGTTTTTTTTTTAAPTTTTTTACAGKVCTVNPAVGGVSSVCCPSNKRCPKSGSGKTTCRRKKKKKN